jgi:hypothetical protein
MYTAQFPYISTNMEMITQRKRELADGTKVRIQVKTGGSN